MQDTNELFDTLLAAYRNADDPDRFLREFLMRLDDATSNAVVAAERKLDRLDAARARLEAARQIPRPETAEELPDTSQNADDDTGQDGGEEQEPEADADQEQDSADSEEPEAEEAEAPPEPKKRKAKRPAAESEAA